MGPVLSSFAPVYREDARILILGSMPGDASLSADQYYAHPRNAFWPIMGALFGAGPEQPYADRLQRLMACGVALWDVIGNCRREGSLDSAIEPDSIVANDIPALINSCPQLTRICFNGTAAEQAFRRHIRLDANGRELNLRRLPSTSPAHAALGLAAKLTAWQQALQ
ncbi:hypothetical protein SDC9_181024 [bioreactor metagenome]|uniref:Uracil-DNA glycosylase-like domain-containing protein n=1 Tax=bioreactor metagenome TaxID=1076179 RepID=A0A645H4Y3_9ZZZZ